MLELKFKFFNNFILLLLGVNTFHLFLSNRCKLNICCPYKLSSMLVFRSSSFISRSLSSPKTSGIVLQQQAGRSRSRCEIYSWKLRSRKERKKTRIKLVCRSRRYGRYYSTRCVFINVGKDRRKCAPEIGIRIYFHLFIFSKSVPDV